MNYWERVDYECEKKGITRKELSYKAGIALSSISAGIIRGGIPRADIAIKIANILELPLEYFFPEIEHPMKNMLAILKKYKDVIEILDKLEEDKRSMVLKMLKALN